MRSKYALTDPSHGSHPSTCSRILVPAERLFKLSSHTHTKEIRRRLSVSRVCMLREVRSSFFPHFISQSKKETGSLFKSIWRKRQKKPKFFWSIFPLYQLANITKIREKREEKENPCQNNKRVVDGHHRELARAGEGESQWPAVNFPASGGKILSDRPNLVCLAFKSCFFLLLISQLRHFHRGLRWWFSRYEFVLSSWYWFVFLDE